MTAVHKREYATLVTHYATDRALKPTREKYSEKIPIFFCVSITNLNFAAARRTKITPIRSGYDMICRVNA